MILQHIKSLFLKKKCEALKISGAEIGELRRKSEKLISDKKFDEAIDVLNEILSARPDDAEAMHDIGVAYWEKKNKVKAAEYFVSAYSLNERMAAAYVNHAMVLIENRDTSAALDVVNIIKHAFPDSIAFSRSYATLLFEEGRIAEAMRHRLIDLLGSESQPEIGSNYLFPATYNSEITEEELTGEHLFWNRCIRPKTSEVVRNAELSRDRIKIAYISPDVKSHSVAFFLRPILASHDKEKFDVTILNDTQFPDDTTNLILGESKARNVDTSKLSNQELQELLIEENFDILIETTGHTAGNRLLLLAKRFANIQISGLGYPPTTGCSNIDYKIVDKTIADHGSEAFYSEKLIVLPESFWCFTPLGNTPPPRKPPCFENGFVTFGVVGNITKISPETVACWVSILRQLPNAHLVLQSFNFQDDGVKNRYKDNLAEMGMPVDRVFLMGPSIGEDFYEVYNKIDIILDTYPFNGGTTTAFSLYMGTPVISKYGKSLCSRMGLSMLTSMGIAEFSADSDQKYIENAILLAKNKAKLLDFKFSARDIFHASAFGNPTKYTQQFENALIGLYKDKKQRASLSVLHKHNLPAAELFRRASISIRLGSMNYARRIADFAREVYPNDIFSVAAHAAVLVAENEVTHAISEVSKALEESNTPPSSDFLKFARRCALADPSHPRSSIVFDLTDKFRDLLATHSDEMDLQSALFDRSRMNDCNLLNSEADINCNHLVIIASRDVAAFNVLMRALKTLIPDSFSNKIRIERANFDNRWSEYSKIISTDSRPGLVVSIFASDAAPMSFRYFSRVERHLNYCDVLSFAGSEVFDRTDWSTVHPDRRSGVWVTHFGQRADSHAIKMLGGKIDIDPVVLSGKMLCMRPSAWSSATMRETLAGGETLMESEWSHQAKLNKKRLRVALDLDIGIFGHNAAPDELKTTAAVWLAEHYHFTEAQNLIEYTDEVLLPCASSSAALLAVDDWLKSMH